jgi:hypothetical protein
VVSSGISSWSLAPGAERPHSLDSHYHLWHDNKWIIYRPNPKPSGIFLFRERRSPHWRFCRCLCSAGLYVRQLLQSLLHSPGAPRFVRQSGRNVGPFPQLSRRLIMSKRTNFHRFKNQTSYSMNPDFTKKHPQNDHNSFRMNNFLVIVLGNPCSIITLQKQPPGYLMRFGQLRSGDKLFYMSSLRRINSAGTTC